MLLSDPGSPERIVIFEKSRICKERAIKEFSVIDATIIHRFGSLPVGENIVLIVIASGHRDEAVTVCRFCIDELKRITPIWKRETTPDGDTWVEEHP